MRNKIYDMCFHVLSSRGKTEPFGAVRAAVHYNLDNKLDLLGVLDKTGERFDTMRVAINLVGRAVEVDVTALLDQTADSRFIPFQVPKSDNTQLSDTSESDRKYTLVYYWRIAPLFYRPGVWVIRLQMLADEIRGNQAFTANLDGDRVDDDKLFDEVKFNDPRRQQL